MTDLTREELEQMHYIATERNSPWLPTIEMALRTLDAESTLAGKDARIAELTHALQDAVTVFGIGEESETKWYAAYKHLLALPSDPDSTHPQPRNL